MVKCVHSSGPIGQLLFCWRYDWSNVTTSMVQPSAVFRTRIQQAVRTCNAQGRQTDTGGMLFFFTPEEQNKAAERSQSRARGAEQRSSFFFMVDDGDPRDCARSLVPGTVCCTGRYSCVCVLTATVSPPFFCARACFALGMRATTATAKII